MSPPWPPPVTGQAAALPLGQDGARCPAGLSTRPLGACVGSGGQRSHILGACMDGVMVEHVHTQCTCGEQQQRTRVLGACVRGSSREPTTQCTCGGSNREPAYSVHALESSGRAPTQSVHVWGAMAEDLHAQCMCVGMMAEHPRAQCMREGQQQSTYTLNARVGSSSRAPPSSAHA